MKLRDYQVECINNIWNELLKNASALVVASTGSGKTVVFVKFVEKCFDTMLRARPDEPFSAMVLVHKIDLVTQAEEKFKSFTSELDTGIYCGSLDKREKAPIIIGSIDSVKKYVPFINLLIVDEYHRFFYRRAYYEYREKLLEKNPKMKTVYFTATPYGKTGYLYGKEDEFEVEKPCFEIGMNILIDQGHLVAPQFKESKEKFDTEGLKLNSSGDFAENELNKLATDSPEKLKVQVQDAIGRLELRRKVIWCCTSIEHAEMVELELLHQGEKAVCVHSKKKLSRQIELVKAFESGSIRHMVSVTKLSEGTDIPPIDAVVCFRPTRSPILYVQMVGRGLRPFKGKTDCLFLDYGGVVEALGHPSDPYIREKSKRKKSKPRALQCPSCFTMNFPPIDLCSDCGYQFLKDEREIDRLRALDLIPYNPDRDGKIAVIDWGIFWNYKSKSGKTMALVTYQTILGPKKEYIVRSATNEHYQNLRTDFQKGKPKYVILENKNQFVKKRLYA